MGKPVKKDFAKLSPDEVAALTGKEKEAFDNWLNELANPPEASKPAAKEVAKPSSKTSKPSSKTSKPSVKEGDEDEEEEDLPFYEEAEKIARNYWKVHKECKHDSLVIVSDGSVFYNTPHGKNAADNHVIAGRALDLKSVIIDR